MENITPLVPAEGMKPKYNRQAVVGFVLTLAGIVLAGMPGDSPLVGIVVLVGLAFGVAGLRKIKVSKEKGRGLAITSIVIGSISLLGFIAAIVLVALQSAR